MGKQHPIFIYIPIILMILLISIFASFLANKYHDSKIKIQDELKASKELKYGVDGKPYGEPLETKPVFVTEDYIIFQDRVLKRFFYDSNKIKIISDNLNEVYGILPPEINKYLMIVPTRNSFECIELDNYSDEEITAINELYEFIASEVIPLDILVVLSQHKDDYIYFRTAHTWTAIGAYYAAEVFSMRAGFELIGINNYYEYRLYHYLGIVNTLYEAQKLEIINDYISYFILDNASNRQTITARLSSREYLTYDAPIIAVSRRGYDIFIGKYFSHSILHGDETNGDTLMILGDSYSKALAPWLTPYYENIILIDLNYYVGDKDDFFQFFSEYNIRDFLVVINVDNIESVHINSTLKQIQTIR